MKDSSGNTKKLKDWFLKNIILPNNEVIDKAGFILQQFNERDTSAFLREMLFPEKMLADIEQQVAKKYGDKGRQALYRAGKRWGYRYAKGTMFPLRKDTNDAEFLGFFDVFSKMIEAEYSSYFKGVPNLANKTIDFVGKDMVICDKSGEGQIFLGAWVGCWAYQYQDMTMEGNHPLCQGRNDSKCVFKCGPRSIIKEIKQDIEKDTALAIELPFYSLNKPHKTRADYSLKRFMELGTITYNGGFFKFGNDRLVLNESSSIYFIEEELRKLKADSIIFDASFEYFRNFGKKYDQDFFIGFLMASGWGEIELYKEAKGYRAVVRNFPWTSLSKKIQFKMLQGVFSGFVSAKEKKKIILDTVETNTLSGRLEVVISGGA